MENIYKVTKLTTEELRHVLLSFNRTVLTVRGTTLTTRYYVQKKKIKASYFKRLCDKTKKIYTHVQPF